MMAHEPKREKNRVPSEQRPLETLDSEELLELVHRQGLDVGEEPDRDALLRQLSEG